MRGRRAGDRVRPRARSDRAAQDADDQFVDLEDVDPIYCDHPYFLVPASDDDGATRAYRLLTEVMSQTERAALGRFVMRAKEKPERYKDAIAIG